MKKILITIICLLCISTIGKSQGQGVPCNNTTSIYICSIKYMYDEAGNRIRREYSCTTVSVGGGTQRMAQQNKDAVLESVIFPNPSNGVFTIKTNMAVPNATVLISDMAGRKLKEVSYSGTDATIDIRTLAIGQYMIQLVLPDAKQVHQLLKNE